MKFIILLIVLLINTLSCSVNERVFIALGHKNLDTFKELFDRLSDPTSRTYGNWMTMKEISDIISPDQSDIDDIINYFEQIGGENFKIMESKDFLSFDLNAKLYQELYSKYYNKVDSKDIMIDIPIFISEKIDYIFGKYHLAEEFKNVGRNAKNNNNNQEKKGKFFQFGPNGTPVEIKKQYKIPLNVSGTNTTHYNMVWGPGTFGVSLDDLQQYYNNYPQIPGLDISNVKIPYYKGVPGGDNFGEGSLDADMISTQGNGVRLVVANTNTSESTEETTGFGYAYIDFIMNLAQSHDLPAILSMSLGSLSYDACQDLCKKVVDEHRDVDFDNCERFMEKQRQVCMMDSGRQEERISIEFMKLGARGVSLFGASGDGGNHFSFNPFPSFNKIGKYLNEVSCKYIWATFPDASGYITAVGGSDWEQPWGNSADSITKIAWSNGGAAFSSRFPMPNYQKSTVAAYLQKPGMPPSFSYNSSMRAYADISALANGCVILQGGFEMNVGGTSCSAPLLAGIFSLINDMRLNKGLPTLGFLNPRIYQVNANYPGEAFFDITQGPDGVGCNYDFPATEGWDLATGVGSPLWPGLVKHFGSD